MTSRRTRTRWCITSPPFQGWGWRRSRFFAALDQNLTLRLKIRYADIYNGTSFSKASCVKMQAGRPVDTLYTHQSSF
jgi:hypothetical protein